MLAIAELDQIIYVHIDDQHPDSMRFVNECAVWFGKPITILQSEAMSVEGAIRKNGTCYINGPAGAECTRRLKKRVRQKWEQENVALYPMQYIWGMDASEQHRADRIRETMPEFEHRFPLIENRIGKAEAHEIMRASGIRRPAMYDLGYHNNNCIGCVKGGMGYWNKIRVDFPDVFASRARLEREIGASCIKGVYLDELAPDAGRHEPPIADDCGIMCELQALKPSEQPNASATMPNDPRSAMSGQKVEEMKCRQCGYAHPIGSNCPPNSELAAPTGSAMWMCPVCKHVMTEEQSKAYRSCPTGIHFVQHVQVELNHPEARCDDCGVTHGTAAAT